MEQLKKKTSAQEFSLNMTEIGRCFRETEAGQVIYSLFREDVDSDRFVICVKSKDQREEGGLSGTLPRVSLLFEKIVNGEVPPYILPEILEDYAKENALYLVKN